MKIKRLLAGTVTAGLLGLTPLAISAPANADATYTTTTTLQATEATTVAYGDTITFNGGVTDSQGSSDVYGNATLMVLSSKNPVWTPVETDPTGGNFWFWDVKPASNSLYKVVYEGYSETSPLVGVQTWTPSESAPVAVKVARKITYPKSGFVLKGKVGPDYKKKKVIIKVSKKADKGFKKYRTIKTNRKGKYSIRLPKRGGTWYWQVRTKGDKHYAPTGYTWRTWVF